MKVNIDRHTTEIAEFQEEIERLREGIRNVLRIAEHPELNQFHIRRELQKLLEEGKDE